MSDLASSCNSSVAGGEAMTLYAASYGTASPSTNFPAFSGTSPPQQYWGGPDSILSSSPMTGPGATFQSLRGRPSSFEHGRTFGYESTSAGHSPSGGTVMLNGMSTIGIVFEDLASSPFVSEESNGRLFGESDDRQNMARRDSDETLTYGPCSDNDDEEDDMMFKLDGAFTKTEKDFYLQLPTVNAKLDEAPPTTLLELLANIPGLNSFPSVNAYVIFVFLSV